MMAQTLTLLIATIFFAATASLLWIYGNGRASGMPLILGYGVLAVLPLLGADSDESAAAEEVTGIVATH